VLVLLAKKKEERVVDRKAQGGIMKSVLIGGRIKAAAVGMDHFYSTNDIVELGERLRQVREHPLPELLQAFFPSDHGRLRQMMRGIGFYHPTLKTDQGMGGNFASFRIDSRAKDTNNGINKFSTEEGIAIPEDWYVHDEGTIRHIQERFQSFDLHGVDATLSELPTRNAERGRSPFFLIRPARTEKDIILGYGIVKRVDEAVNNLLEVIAGAARETEATYAGKSQDSNLLYCQPDVFIMADGTVVVEKINCPDVGLFLCGIANPFSTILPGIQAIMRELLGAVCQTIACKVASRTVALITRDEVLEHKEDVLERTEIKVLGQGLASLGVKSRVYTVSQVSGIPEGSFCILLNLDYHTPDTDLLSRHSRGELVCYPNPFFQMACQRMTGLVEHNVPSQYRESFLRLIGSHPKDEEATRNVWGQIENLLCKYGIESDILHVDIGDEIVPVFRRSMHSWQQLANIIKKRAFQGQISIREVPVEPGQLMVTSDTGPRLHTFRFMFTKV
jgi:hypothetical protein